MNKKSRLRKLKIDGILEISRKNYYVVKKEVLEEILELVEDIYDIKIARQRLGKPSVSLEEFERTLRVDQLG